MSTGAQCEFQLIERSTRGFGPPIPLESTPGLLYNVHMQRLELVWDARKNRTNQSKHGVSFEEARTAFYDENAKVYFDPDHSQDEDRFLLLGMSQRLRVLVVCHCYREKEGKIRIISARRADRGEEQEYWR